MRRINRRFYYTAKFIPIYLKNLYFVEFGLNSRVMDNVHCYTHDLMGSEMMLLLTVVLSKIIKQKNELN